MKTIEIEVNGVSKTYHVAKPKYRKRMSIVGQLRKDTSGAFDTKNIPLGNIADYQVALIAACVVNDDGKPAFTPDEIDEWDDKQISDVATKLDAALNPDNAVKVEQGNSEATGN